MKGFLHSIFATAVVLSLSSCKTSDIYYQVCEMQADASLQKVQNEGVTSEAAYAEKTSDCKISYNFWAKGGDLSFELQNNSDRNIYVYLPECFAIINGTAHDYYQNLTYSYTEGSSATAAKGSSVSASSVFKYAHTPYLGTAQASSSAALSSLKSQSYQVNAPIYICIPAHSSKTIDCPISMCNGAILDCQHPVFPHKATEPVTFTKESSPLVIENRIAYSFSPDGKNLVRLNHQFWLSKYTNYSEKGIFNKETWYNCLETGGFSSSKEVQTFVNSSSHSFYNEYDKSTTAIYSKQKNAKNRYRDDDIYNSNAF